MSGFRTRTAAVVVRFGPNVKLCESEEVNGRGQRKPENYLQCKHSLTC